MHVKPGGAPLIVQVQPFPDTAVIVMPTGGSVTVTVPLVLPAFAALDTVTEYCAFCSPGLKFPEDETAAVRAGGVWGVGVSVVPPPPFAQPMVANTATRAEILRTRRARKFENEGLVRI